MRVFRLGLVIADPNLQSVRLARQLRAHFVAVIRRNDGSIGALFENLEA